DTRGDGTPVVVFNPLAHSRTDTVSVDIDLDHAGGLTLVDESRAPVPYLTEALTRTPDGRPSRARLRWVARDVPSMGYRTYRLLPGSAAASTFAWRPAESASIANDRYRIRADVARGGALTEMTDLAQGRSIVPAGQAANELVCVAEHPEHPEF